MLSKQEMFDRAVRGLASQGFERCVDQDLCQYYDPKTKRRCAWGWVDPEATQGVTGMSVKDLMREGIGLAGLVTSESQFILALQLAHDRPGALHTELGASTSPRAVFKALKYLGQTYQLDTAELDSLNPWPTT